MEHFEHLVLKHTNSMDVCFEVTHMYFNQHRQWLTVRGRWWNMGYVESWPLASGMIYIKKEDISNWKMCNDLDSDCLRHDKWSRSLSWKEK